MTAGTTGDQQVVAGAHADPDMPDEIDFSDSVRGTAGQRLVVQWARYRRALREISQRPDVEKDPLRAAREIQDRARQALDEDGAELSR